MTIKEMANRAYKTAVDHGFHENERSFGDAIALVHSELSEALEGHRSIKPFYNEVLKSLEITEVTQKLSGPADEIHGYYSQNGWFFSANRVMEHAKALQRENIAEELADAVIRIGDMSLEFGVDLEEAIAKKMAFNETRPYKHGKDY